MNCPLALYDTKADAAQVRRMFQSRMQLYSSILYCEACDGYHTVVRDFNDAMTVRYDRPKTYVQQRVDPPRARYGDTVKIIELAAKGYSEEQMGTMLGITGRVVSHHLERAQRRLYALNRANLVAICCAVGIVDPRSFVPEIVDKEHE